MDLTKLFKAQKELDDRIVKEKGLEGQYLLDKKILALQVELGELANEWRGFKFWSENQEPRTVEHKFERNVDDLGNIESLKNPLLEEYVDCLHFMLSIGNDFEVNSDDVYIDTDNFSYRNTSENFLAVFYYASNLDESRYQERGLRKLKIDYLRMFYSFIKLGDMLGFTWDEIEQAYFDKNKINHERQVNGY